MICLIALLVFGVLGIFSATHRKTALEAFDCVFKKITLRKCETGLDSRLKAQISGSIIKRSPKAGRFVFRHFEFISTVFTILLILSSVYSGLAIYNYYTYGNCNGPGESGFCIFAPVEEKCDCNLTKDCGCLLNSSECDCITNLNQEKCSESQIKSAQIN